MKASKLVLITLGMMLAACAEEKNTSYESAPIQVEQPEAETTDTENTEDVVVEEEQPTEEPVVIEGAEEVVGENSENVTEEEPQDISFGGPIDRVRSGAVFSQNNSGYSLAHSFITDGSRIEILKNDTLVSSFDLRPKNAGTNYSEFMRIKNGRVYKDPNHSCWRNQWPCRASA